MEDRGGKEMNRSGERKRGNVERRRRRRRANK